MEKNPAWMNYYSFLIEFYSTMGKIEDGIGMIDSTAFFLAVHASIWPEEITFIQNFLKQSIPTRNKIDGKSKFQIKPFVKIWI